VTGRNTQENIIFYTSPKNEAASIDDMAASFTVKFNEYPLCGIKKALGFMHRILHCTSEPFPFIFEAPSCAHPYMFSKGKLYFLSSCKMTSASSPDVCLESRQCRKCS
jgi:hypothetical protein